LAAIGQRGFWPLLEAVTNRSSSAQLRLCALRALGFRPMLPNLPALDPQKISVPVLLSILKEA